MAFYDPTPMTPGETRLARPLHLSWSALWGGNLLGWSTLFLLSLVGAAVGFASVEASSNASVFGDRLARIGLGVGVWGLVAMLIAAFVGSFFVVRIAGERRRREGLLHAAIGWALSTVALGLLAVTAAGSAATTTGQAASVNRPAIQRKVNARDDGRGGKLTPRDQAAIENTSGTTAKALGAAAGALGLSFVLSMLGGLLACATMSGRRLVDELGFNRSDRNGQGEPRVVTPRPSKDRDIDQPTIIPPTH
jgi:hypothetical protein